MPDKIQLYNAEISHPYTSTAIDDVSPAASRSDWSLSWSLEDGKVRLVGIRPRTAYAFAIGVICTAVMVAVAPAWVTILALGFSAGLATRLMFFR